METQMNRRIVLLDLYWTRPGDPRVPLGHASLLAALRAVGVEAQSLVVPVDKARSNVRALAEAIFDQCGGLAGTDCDVAIGAYVWGEDVLRALLRELRGLGFRGRIVLGGPQISYAGAGLEVLYPEANAFVRGYGEDALVLLARSDDRAPISGVHYSGDVDRCIQASVDLERLPSPWLLGAVSLASESLVRWETQRGCPFRCSFCQHREAGARLKRRGLDESRTMAEIDLFCRSGVSNISVLDPIFNLDSRSTSVLMRFAERSYRGRISLQCRAELVDDAFLEAAQVLRVCLEFGLQTIHRDEGTAVRRNNDIGLVDHTLAKVRSRGIDHEASLIFGLPGQTVRSFTETVQWCLERQIPRIKAFPLLLLRGTKLDADRSKWGLVDDGTPMAKVVQSNSFTRSEWDEMDCIAEALRATEGRHPATVHDLLH
jgi:hypothetical protein